MIFWAENLYRILIVYFLSLVEYINRVNAEMLIYYSFFNWLVVYSFLLVLLEICVIGILS
ncbi:hypothetical protein DWV37_10375 [Tannerella sp. AF04-6]|jgi:hypothetical protein|nr:hypothetical protein DWV37_10375 [Tannerella sp. AF04-6]